MEWKIVKKITLEGWMDKQFQGENISQRDIDSIVVFAYEGGTKVFKVLSGHDLSDDEKKRYHGYI